MKDDLPEHFFRVREGGALVFRVDGANRNRRIELDPIAVIDLPRGEVKPRGDAVLSEADREAIRHWIAERRAIETMREIDDIHRTIDHLNRTAHWAQSSANDAQLKEVTDALLLAMHDLRAVLVRKKAERVTRA